MKKVLFFVFSLIPSLVWAIECNSPKVCTLKASDVCTNKKLKLLGTDECVECVCPDGQTEVSDGTCCENEVAQEIYGGKKICCSSGEVVIENEDRTGEICCTSNFVMTGKDGKQVCDCPEDWDGNKGTLIIKDGKQACCFDYMGWSDFAKEYVYENELCGCPIDKDGNQGNTVTKGGLKHCCFNNKSWNSLESLYNGEFYEFCGCPIDEDGNQGSPVTKDGWTHCCFNNKGWSYKGYNLIDHEFCGCPTGSHEVQDNNGKYYCCPIGQEIILPGGQCCDGEGVPTWELIVHKCDQYHWGEQEWMYCMKPTPSLSTKRCPTNYHRYTYDDTNAVLLCETEMNCSDGVVVELENRKCKCGCYNNDDCSKFWRIGTLRKECQNDHTCALPETLNFDDFSVEYTDFANGKITEEKLKNAILHLKGTLKETTGNTDKIEIQFDGINSDGYLSTADGYSSSGDKKTIHVKSIKCKIISETTLSCSGTIIHENVHRVDNINQPLWHKLESSLGSIYQSLLSEIRAQSRGTREDIINALENCYRKKDGEVYSILNRMHIKNHSENEINDCKHACLAVNSYDRNVKAYINLKMAKRYFNNDPYFQAENCDGLVGVLEKDFIDSHYARTSYIQAKIKAYDELRDWADRNKVMNDKVKIAAEIGNTGWEWNNDALSYGKMIARMYKQHAKLCMTEDEFASNNNINLGFNESNYRDLAGVTAITGSNPDCAECWSDESKLETEACKKCKETLECSMDKNHEKCTPVSEFYDSIGDEYTMTL